MCGLCQVSAESINKLESSDNSMAKPSQNNNAAVAIALPEVSKNTCTALQKLLIMVSC